MYTTYVAFFLAQQLHTSWCPFTDPGYFFLQILSIYAITYSYGWCILYNDVDAADDKSVNYDDADACVNVINYDDDVAMMPMMLLLREGFQKAPPSSKLLLEEILFFGNLL